LRLGVERKKKVAKVRLGEPDWTKLPFRIFHMPSSFQRRKGWTAHPPFSPYMYMQSSATRNWSYLIEKERERKLNGILLYLHPFRFLTHTFSFFFRDTDATGDMLYVACRAQQKFGKEEKKPRSGGSPHRTQNGELKKKAFESDSISVLARLS
jgi:hypothetical protein